jgi:hypothetical protein
MSCAAFDGGTMAERVSVVSFRERLAGLSEGTPRRLSIVFLVQLARHSESILSVLGEESATGDEPSKMPIVPAWRGQVQLLGLPQGKLTALSWDREIIPDSRRGRITEHVFEGWGSLHSGCGEGS